jgi:hypothetical protein
MKPLAACFSNSWRLKSVGKHCIDDAWVEVAGPGRWPQSPCAERQRVIHDACGFMIVTEHEVDTARSGPAACTKFEGLAHQVVKG